MMKGSWRTGRFPCFTYHTHPIKAARTAALCWVFSIVQRKDRPSAGFSHGRRRQAAGEAGTKCRPHERGYYGHFTGWERISGIRRRTSYFFRTYRSSFQGGYGLFLFDTFLSYSRTYYKRIHGFLEPAVQGPGPAVLFAELFDAAILRRGGDQNEN